MNLTINIPDGWVWIFCGLFMLGAAINVWHAVELHRHSKKIDQL